MVTGFSSLEVAVESMRIGAHDYLVKPVNIDELKKSIKGIISEREELIKGKKNLSDVVKRIEIVDEGTIIVAKQDILGQKNMAFALLKPVIIIVKQMKRYFWDIY